MGHKTALIYSFTRLLIRDNTSSLLKLKHLSVLPVTSDLMMQHLFTIGFDVTQNSSGARSGRSLSGASAENTGAGGQVSGPENFSCPAVTCNSSPQEHEQTRAKKQKISAAMVQDPTVTENLK